VLEIVKILYIIASATPDNPPSHHPMEFPIAHTKRIMFDGIHIHMANLCLCHRLFVSVPDIEITDPMIAIAAPMSFNK
jgi:hypothetical protein